MVAQEETFLTLITTKTHSSNPAIFIPPSSLSNPTNILSPFLPKDQTREVTYDGLGTLVEDFRRKLLGWGSGAGDTVAMSLINGLEFVVGFLAVGINRSVAAPLNPTYSEPENDFYLSDSSASLLLVPRLSKHDAPAVQAAKKRGVTVVEVWWDEKKGIEGRVLVQGKNVKTGLGSGGEGRPQGDDVALLLHTSGTTGRPKAVPLTHRNLVTTMKNIKQTYHFTPSDRSFLVMPLFHVHGLLAGLLAPLYSGSSIVLPSKFSAKTFWPEFDSTSCTFFTAVPTIHQILLRGDEADGGGVGRRGRLRFIRSCSSALDPTTMSRLSERFGVPVLEAYAMTEACHQMTSNPLPPRAQKPSTVGIPQGIKLKILSASSPAQEVEEGEVCIQGLNVTKGYLNNPKANEESFVAIEGKEGEGRWFRTGDRGRLDKEGYLMLTGRIKELINRGGEKISPLEVDSALLALPGVAEAVSFAVPDLKYGQVPWAAVVPSSSAKSLTESDIKNGLKGKLSGFKIPEKVFVVKEIGKTSTGKIQRRKLVDQFSKEVEEKRKRDEKEFGDEAPRAKL